MQTVQTLLPYLQLLAGAGSGWVASWLFDQLRDDWLLRPYWPAWAAHALDTAIYRPLGARISVFVLTGLVALLVGAGVAFVLGQPVGWQGPALAIVLGQLRHGVMNFGTTIDVDLEGEQDARDSNP